MTCRRRSCHDGVCSKTAFAAGGAYAAGGRGAVAAAPAELKLRDDIPAEKFDFDTKGIEGWTIVGGQWAVEDMTGAPSGRRVLVQRATRNEVNVIVAPPGPFTDLDISVKVKPIAGREDAAGGIVFRFSEGKGYVVRTNALEGNFRLYYYDRGRRQIAHTSIKASALGRWHTIRVVAVDARMQAWLNDTLLLTSRDTRLRNGRVGLWTTNDSNTAFDDLTIRGMTAVSEGAR